MTSAVNGSSPFVPKNWTLSDNLKKIELPAVSEIQKKRADDLSTIKMPVIGKKKRYYGQIELSTVFKKLETYSLDIEIAGKTAYHIGGSELAKEVSALLNCPNIIYKKETLKDIDIRVIVQDLTQYNSFVDFLHDLFPRASKSDIVNDLILASHSDQESISFSFGDENSITCDILFSFKPSRKHLFWSDAFRYSKKENKFVTDLENPLQGVSDYFNNVVQTDAPKTINKKGWPKFLVRKAKGAKIPDASLEEQLFINVVNSKKRKELVLEIIDLVTKAGNKAAIAFEDLLYEGSLILEKTLKSDDFKKIWMHGKGKIAEAVAKNIPFHVIHAYLQLIGQKKGNPDYIALFTTPFKKELDQIFTQTLEERLAPLLFFHPNPRTAWNFIKSKKLAESTFLQILENDPLFAKEVNEEYALPYKPQILKALLSKGYIEEADNLYDEVKDESILEELTLKLLAQDPSSNTFHRYLKRSGGNVSAAVSAFCIAKLPFNDLIDLASILMPLSKTVFFDRIRPFLNDLPIEKALSFPEELKREGIRLHIRKQIDAPRAKEWRKLIEYADDDDIEPWLIALLDKVSVNEARQFCLHPKVILHKRHKEMVSRVTEKANLTQKSLFWDILDLSLSYHPEEAVRLIELSRGNTSGLPKTVLAKMAEVKSKLFALTTSPFTLAECLNDLNIEPLSLAANAVRLKFNSLSLLKGGWLGKDPFDLETSLYFIEHDQFESFYPHIAGRLHPEASINTRLELCIKEKKFGFAVTLTTAANSSKALEQLRGQNIKERIDLLKKFGREADWEIYLKENQAIPDEVFSYLLSQPVSDAIKNSCIERSATAWEPYLSQPEKISSACYPMLFRRGFRANKQYCVLKKIKEKSGPIDPEIERCWETQVFFEEPYSLERTLKQQPGPREISALTAKIYAARPSKDDWVQLEPWLKEKNLEIQFYFNPLKTTHDLLLIRPNNALFESLFLKAIELNEVIHLRAIYTQFDEAYRAKYRKTFLIHITKDLSSHPFMITEYRKVSPHEREFEYDFISALYDESAPLAIADWPLFHMMWLDITESINTNSKARTAALTPNKFDWENEEAFIKGLISLDNEPRVKKLLQQDLKEKKAEAAHACKVALIPLKCAIKRKFDGEPAQEEMFDQIIKLIPYHNLITTDFDEVLFDFAALVAPSLSSGTHLSRCKTALRVMEENQYNAHYPGSAIAISLLIEGFQCTNVKLNEIASKLIEISLRINDNFNKADKIEFEKTEEEFAIHLRSIFKAQKRLLEFDTFFTYVRAWLIISNIQISLISLGKFDWIYKFYRPMLPNFPKYAFSETRQNQTMAGIAKGLINDLLKESKKIKECPLFYNLLPEYIDTLFKSLEICPALYKQAFIADIMSYTLQYSDGKIKIIFDKLIDYIEKIIELTLQHSNALQIEWFTQGISEPLTQFVKESNLNESEQMRLKECLRKYKEALRNQNLIGSLDNLILHWSLHEKTLNIIAPR